MKFGPFGGKYRSGCFLMITGHLRIDMQFRSQMLLTQRYTQRQTDHNNQVFVTFMLTGYLHCHMKTLVDFINVMVNTPFLPGFHH